MLQELTDLDIQAVILARTSGAAVVLGDRSARGDRTRRPILANYLQLNIKNHQLLAAAN
ncbi:MULTISPECIES: hypothetical protein [Microcoleaceae]|uniref:hypothetical protein n=1 Tax=Microcoleaceae TaxID=1892252 RepID=UPI00187EB8C6|nr:hypothetical protein [Tychonema sp. LEGE 06208]MBE9163339.1 hypothetical protein [Tychonema sp. LEGE 06208]